MAIETRDVQANAEGKFPCPECDKSYNDKAHLGIHRRKSHLVLGRDATTTGLPPKGRGKTTTVRRNAKKAVTPGAIAKMLRLRAEGLSLREIGEKFGRGPAFVDYYIRIKSNGKPKPKPKHKPPQERIAHVNPDSNSEHLQAANGFESDLIYFYGRTEAQAQLYCDANQIPWQVFAAGLADLFKVAGSGVRHRVSALPSQTAR